MKQKTQKTFRKNNSEKVKFLKKEVKQKKLHYFHDSVDRDFIEKFSNKLSAIKTLQEGSSGNSLHKTLKCVYWNLWPFSQKSIACI